MRWPLWVVIDFRYPVNLLNQLILKSSKCLNTKIEELSASYVHITVVRVQRVVVEKKVVILKKKLET